VRTLSTNVTNGIAGDVGSKPVLLLLVTLADGTIFRWSTKSTADFIDWTGDTFVGDVISHVSSISTEVDIPRFGSRNILGNFDFDLVNAAYSGTTRFDEYLVDEGVTMEGATVEVRLIFDATNATWTAAAIIGYGKVVSTSFDLDTYSVNVQTDGKDGYVQVPVSVVRDVAGWDGDPEYTKGETEIPFVYGNVADLYVPSVVTITTFGEQRVQIDTEKCYGLSSLWVSGYRCDRDMVEIAADKNYIDWMPVSASAPPNAGLVPLEGVYDTSPTGWTNEAYTFWFIGTTQANVYDDNLSTSARVNGTIGAPPYNSHRVDFTGMTHGLDSDSPILRDLWGVAVRVKTRNVATYNHPWFKFMLADSGSSWSAGLTVGDNVELDGFEPHEKFFFGVSAGDWTFAGLVARGMRVARESGNDVTVERFTDLFEIKMDWVVAESFSSADFLSLGVYGREYNNTDMADGVRYGADPSTLYISSPVAAIEHLLRLYHPPALSEINETSFNQAYTDCNAWGRAATEIEDEWAIGGWQTRKQNLRDCIEDICEEFGLAYLQGFDGTIKLAMVQPQTSVYEFDLGDILAGSLVLDATRLSEVRNSFVLRYGYNESTQLWSSVSINKDSGIVEGSSWFYLQRACQESFDAYGVTQELKIDLKWIASENAARKALDWHVWRRRKCPKLARWKSSGIQSLAVEVMDSVTVKHPLTEATVGEDFIVYSVVFDWQRMTIEYRGIRVEDMNRDSGPVPSP